MGPCRCGGGDQGGKFVFRGPCPTEASHAFRTRRNHARLPVLRALLGDAPCPEARETQAAKREQTAPPDSQHKSRLSRPLPLGACSSPPGAVFALPRRAMPSEHGENTRAWPYLELYSATLRVRQYAIRKQRSASRRRSVRARRQQRVRDSAKDERCSCMLSNGRSHQGVLMCA